MDMRASVKLSMKNKGGINEAWLKKLFPIMMILLISLCLVSCKGIEDNNGNGSLDKPDENTEENLGHIEENVYNVSLGMNILKVNDLLGESPEKTIVTPSSILSIVNEENRTYKNGLSIYTIDDTVFEFCTNQIGTGFEKGVVVGDDYHKLIQLYGEPSKKNENTLEYYFQQDGRNVVKSFSIAENRIQSIAYSSLEGDIPKREFINTEDYILDRIFLDMKEKDFLRVFTNTPAAIEVDESTDLKQKLYKYDDGTKVRLIKSGNDPEYEIYSIKFINKTFMTNRGLKIGDSVGKALDLYGFPLYDEGNVLSYGYDGYEYTNFILTTEKNRVTEITISLTL